MGLASPAIFQGTGTLIIIAVELLALLPCISIRYWLLCTKVCCLKGFTAVSCSYCPHDLRVMALMQSKWCTDEIEGILGCYYFTDRCLQDRYHLPWKRK